MITVYDLATDEKMHFHNGMISGNEYEKLAMAVCYCYAEKHDRLSEYFSLTHSGDCEKVFEKFPVYIGKISVGCGDFVARSSEE